MFIDWLNSLTTLQKIAQIEGIFALSFYVISFQQKKQNMVMIFQTLGCLMWTIHMVLLQAPAGILVNAICMFRGIIYYYKAKGYKFASSDWWMYGQLIIFPLVSAFSILFFHETWIAIFPAIASMIGAITLSKTAKVARQGQLLLGPFWVVYDLFNMTIPGLISDSITFLSAILGIIRIDMKEKNRK